MQTPVINFTEKFSLFSDLWSPRIIAQDGRTIYSASSADADYDQGVAVFTNVSGGMIEEQAYDADFVSHHVSKL